MFDLFNITRDGRQSLSSPGSWHSSKRLLLQNLQKTVDYYRAYPQYVSSSHILIKIIYAMNVSRGVSVDRFLTYCKQRAPNVAQSMKLASSYSKGNLWDGDFYGRGSKEILLSVDEWFDVNNSDRNWKDLRSVQVLHHCKSDLTGMIPDGRTTSAEQGLAVISINIPMLMVQYYHWNSEQDRRAQSGLERGTIMQFLYSYVLTNMLYSHQDYALFNRMRRLSEGRPVGVSLMRHSFFLASVHDEVDKSLKIVDAYNRGQEQIDLYSKLQNIPTITAENFTQVADLPDVAPTLQVFWILIVARLNILSYIVGSYRNPRAMLSKDLYAITRKFKSNNVASAAKSSMGAALWATVEDDFKVITQT